MTLNNCNSIIHFADVGNAHVILARHIDMESCAYSYRALIETVNMTSTAFGPSYDYPGDENLVKLKDCTQDARAHLVSLFYFFSAKKIQVLVSFRF